MVCRKLSLLPFQASLGGGRPWYGLVIQLAAADSVKYSGMFAVNIVITYNVFHIRQICNEKNQL